MKPAVMVSVLFLALIAVAHALRVGGLAVEGAEGLIPVRNPSVTRPIWRRQVFLVACTTALACHPTPTVERDLAPLMQTDTLAYALTRSDAGYATRIAYTFRNETGEAVVLPNCHGDTRPMLQKERDGRWYDAWEPFRDRCKSPPVVIAPGEAFSDTVNVFGAPPGSNLLPAFVFPEVEGVYRLFWVQARPPGDSTGAPDMERSLEMAVRVSNPFVLYQ